MRVKQKDKDVFILRTTAIDPEPRVEKTARWLHEAGFRVTVLGWDRERTSKGKEVVNGIKIERSRFKGKYGAGMGNLIGLVHFNLHILIRLFQFKPNVVHACDLDTLIPALIYCKLTGNKLVYDIFDFYAESRYVWKLKRQINQLERWACKKCDSVIIVHEKRIEQLEPISDVTRSRIEVIYNTPDEIKISLPDVESDYFCYVGVLHSDRGIEYVIKAVKQISTVRFIYAGYGPLQYDLALLSSDASNIYFMGRVDYRTALRLEAGALAIIAFYDSSFGGNNIYAAPNKLFEALMLGKPLITSEGTLLANIVKLERIGYVIPFGDEDLLRKALLYIINNPEDAKLKGKRARNLYERKYSAQIAKKRLLGIYSKIWESAN